MMAEIVASTLEKITPWLEDLGLLAVCPCLETTAARERRERRAVLLQGAKFKRKKHTFGMNLGSTETLSVKLESAALHWLVVPAGSGQNSGYIEMADVASAGAKGETTIHLMSTLGDLLLEIEAEDGDVRDEWVQGLNEAIPSRSSGHVPKMQPSTMTSRMQKESYFMQKDAELASKQKAATAKKEKYLQGAGGLKFTALAMANRD